MKIATKRITSVTIILLFGAISLIYNFRFEPNSENIKLKQLALQSLRIRLQKVQSKCGQICITEKSKTTVLGKRWYDVVRKRFTCENMFKFEFFDTKSEFEHSPKQIPDFLYDEFSYQGRVLILYQYRNGQKWASKRATWSRTFVDSLVNKTKYWIPISAYGEDAYLSLSNGLKQAPIRDAHILVIGSQSPWVEAMLLSQGAKHISTLDYTTIDCDHPQITTYTPTELSASFLNGTLPVFDGVVSYSSIEHSGLGRYGDGLNPHGDLIAMARAWCLVKDLGFAIVGVPMGVDQVVFNLHRIYGEVMGPHLFANWQHVYKDKDIDFFSPEKGFNTSNQSSVDTVHLLHKNKTLFNIYVRF